MSNERRRVLAVVVMSMAMLVFGPSLASAYHGTLVTCIPSTPSILMTVKPGLTCADNLNKIALSATKASQLNSCVGNATAPWSSWASVKYGSGATTTDVGNISKADLTLKAVAVYICDYNGDTVNTPLAQGAGKIQFYDALGAKIKTGKSSFAGVLARGTIAGGQSFMVSGLVTKGFGLGATVEAQLLFDTTACGNDAACSGLLACNTLGCPNVFTPATVVHLNGDGSTSYLRIVMPSNGDCTGVGTPIRCCTGVGSGNCLTP